MTDPVAQFDRIFGASGYRSIRRDPFQAMTDEALVEVLERAYDVLPEAADVIAALLFRDKADARMQRELEANARHKAEQVERLHWREEYRHKEGMVLWHRLLEDGTLDPVPVLGEPFRGDWQVQAMCPYVLWSRVPPVRYPLNHFRDWGHRGAPANVVSNHVTESFSEAAGRDPTVPAASDTTTPLAKDTSA